MKVRFLVYNAYGMGGTVRTVINMANSLISRGYDIEIISVKKTAQKPLFQYSEKIKFISIFVTVKGEATIDSATEEERRLIAQKSTIIHEEEEMYENFNAYIDMKLLALLRGLQGGVLITTIPSFNMMSAEYVDSSVLKIGQEHKCLEDHLPGIVHMIQQTYGKLDMLTILTKKNYDSYRNLILNKELEITVLGNGTERMYVIPPLKNKVIIAAGRYVKEKGFDLLIDAFSLIAEEFPDWKLKIFGRGALRDSYVEQVLKNNLENQVYLCPATDQLLKEIANSSFFVCSSIYEGFGMIIIEAMSVGVPVVSFACQGPAEILIDGEDGFLVPERDVEALAEKMRLLIQDEDLRKKMGKRAQLSSEKFSNNAVADKLEGIIFKLQAAKMIQGERNHSV